MYPYESYAPQFNLQIKNERDQGQDQEDEDDNLPLFEEMKFSDEQQISSNSPLQCFESRSSVQLGDIVEMRHPLSNPSIESRIESSEEISPHLINNMQLLYQINSEYKSIYPSAFHEQQRPFQQLQLNPIFIQNDVVTSILSEEPFMKITVLKSIGEPPSMQNEYFVTPRGMVNSQRSPPTYGDITIGRQQVTELGRKPNDILLPISDLAISRTHCRIIYQQGFSSLKQRIPITWLEFSKLFHEKSLSKGRQYLPIELRMIIINYLREPRNFYIQDLGSVHGTYVKVSKDRSCRLRKGQNYQIGTDIYINIIDIQNPFYFNDQFVDSYDEFMSYIAREYVSQTKIYGVEKHEFSKYITNRSNYTFVDQSIRIPRPYSMVKIEVITSGGISSYHLFIAQKDNQSLEYKVGRAATCDIVISQNTISREQCRFMFEECPLEKRTYWSIRDGNDKESSNGTWLCLTDYRLRSFKQESPLEILYQNSEIKISDQILKVEWTDQNLL